MTEYLDRIKQILGPPKPPPAPDWQPVANYLGTPLPKSFTSFVETYGFGALGTIIFPHPSPTADGFRDLLTQLKEGRKYLEYRRQTWQYAPSRGVPYPIHPEPAGLIRWATSIDGEGLFFLATPAAEPGLWPIIWHDPASLHHTWTEFPGPFDHFLYDLMTRTLPLPDELNAEHEDFCTFKPLGNGFNEGP
jgi:hypothetical protein